MNAPRPSKKALALAREVLNIEADAVRALGARLDRRFLDALTLILGCRGRVVVSGIGKSGHVARKIASAIGRVDYCRVRLVDGKVEPIALSGASILSSTTRADGFVLVPAESEGYGPGTEVTVFLYE